MPKRDSRAAFIVRNWSSTCWIVRSARPLEADEPTGLASGTATTRVSPSVGTMSPLRPDLLTASSTRARTAFFLVRLPNEARESTFTDEVGYLLNSEVIQTLRVNNSGHDLPGRIALPYGNRGKVLVLSIPQECVVEDQERQRSLSRSLGCQVGFRISSPHNAPRTPAPVRPVGQVVFSHFLLRRRFRRWQFSV